jgi:hypothetical protein
MFWLGRAQVGVSAATSFVVAAGVALHGRDVLQRGALYRELGRECFIVYGFSIGLTAIILYRVW